MYFCFFSFYLCWTIDRFSFQNIAWATFEFPGVVSGTSTAVSSTVSFSVSKSIGVLSAASFGGFFGFLNWTIISDYKPVDVFQVIVNNRFSGSKSREYKLDHVQKEITFDHTASGGANVVWVSSFTITDNIESFSCRNTHARVVRLGPWSTNFAGFFFTVVHGALVTLTQQPAQSVDFVDWVASSFSNVLVKVAPASV